MRSTQKLIELAWPLAMLLLAPSAWAGEPAWRLRSVRVVIRVADEPVARGGIHRARLNQAVTLHAAVEATRAGRRFVFSDAGALSLEGRAVPAGERAGPERLAGLELRWYKVQPTGQAYNNTVGGFHWEPIRYRRHPLGDWGPDWSRPADGHPLGDYPDTHGGAGTMAFQVEARLGEQRLASPGPESTFRGGLGPEVPRVAFRRDDSYLGRLTELFNTPYIWGSAGASDADHQAERLIGSDCADFVVYGARRLGKPIPYRASWHIPEVTRLVARSERVDAAGRFLDRAGQPLPIAEDGIRIGDLLLFVGHVGALAEDRPPLGVLDDNDVMLHTYWAPPAEEPIRQTAYAKAKLRVMRFR